MSVVRKTTVANSCHTRRECWEAFVTNLSDVFWYVDTHRATLANRQCRITKVFDKFAGYNVPNTHNHIKTSIMYLSFITILQLLFLFLTFSRHLKRAVVCFNMFIVLVACTRGIFSGVASASQPYSRNIHETKSSF